MAELSHHQIALIPDPDTVPFAEVVRVAAALQTQVTKDLAQFWPVSATISAHQGDPPLGVWPIFIVAGATDGQIGYHDVSTKQPQATVYAVAGWPAAASHECIEMLVDPWGNSLRIGLSLNSDGSDNSSEHVQYLVEACDPVATGRYTHPGSDLQLSDFCTQAYYTDPDPTPGQRYSFAGTARSPRNVTAGGYLSWRRADNSWWQLSRDLSGNASIQRLPGLPGQLPLRTFVDRGTYRLRQAKPSPASSKRLKRSSKS